jgi:hypothetical protein
MTSSHKYPLDFFNTACVHGQGVNYSYSSILCNKTHFLRFKINLPRKTFFFFFFLIIMLNDVTNAMFKIFFLRFAFF